MKATRVIPSAPETVLTDALVEVSVAEAVEEATSWRVEDIMKSALRDCYDYSDIGRGNYVSQQSRDQEDTMCGVLCARKVWVVRCFPDEVEQPDGVELHLCYETGLKCECG